MIFFKKQYNEDFSGCQLPCRYVKQLLDDEEIFLFVMEIPNEAVEPPNNKKHLIFMYITCLWNILQIQLLNLPKRPT